MAEVGRAGSTPERRFVFELKLGADSRDALVSALHHIEFLIASEQMTEGCSGGFDSGYTYSLKENPEMDHDKFFLELNEYLAARHSAQPPPDREEPRG